VKERLGDAVKERLGGRGERETRGRGERETRDAVKERPRDAVKRRLGDAVKERLGDAVKERRGDAVKERLGRGDWLYRTQTERLCRPDVSEALPRRQVNEGIRAMPAGSASGLGRSPNERRSRRFYSYGTARQSLRPHIGRAQPASDASPLCHRVSASLFHRVTASLCHRVSASLFDRVSGSLPHYRHGLRRQTDPPGFRRDAVEVEDE
jgi:hypothetical protein